MRLSISKDLGLPLLKFITILDTNVFLHISACSRTVLLSPEDIAGQSTFGMASHGGGKIPLEIREAASALREVRCRVRPEGGFKNRNRKPDLAKHNSGSFYRNRNIFLDIPVQVNPEPEIQILVPVPT